MGCRGGQVGRWIEATTLDAAYAANPTRFGHRRPQPPKLPTVAWINEPTEHTAQTE